MRHGTMNSSDIVGGVGSGDGGPRVGEYRPGRVHHRLIRLRHAVPPVVAVHGVVAPAQRRHLRPCRQCRFQRRQRIRARAWRGVAPIGEGMHLHLDACRRQDVRQRHGMVAMRVHAARRHQAHQVAHPARRPQRVDQPGHRRPPRQAAIGDRTPDARQLLHHHPARADVEVADLGIAHLAVRQPDILATGAQEGVRPGP